MIRGVLFDLDGTLLDSAPDLADAANHLLAQRALPPVSAAQIRHAVSGGTRQILAAVLGAAILETPDFEALKQDFLAAYGKAPCRASRLFPGVSDMLDALENRGYPWGIVTNKSWRFAHDIVRTLALQDRCRVLIGGDTTATPKPHPAPLLLAAEALDIAPSACIYLGDDIRDVSAGKAAGMTTAIAAWGYVPTDTDLRTWGAQHILTNPGALQTLLAA